MVAITNIVVGSLAASAAYASPMSLSCKAYQTQLTNIVQEIPQAQNFCASWLASKQATSPIKGMPGAILTQACKCATQDTASARVLATTPRGPGPLAGAAAASVCKNPQLAKILSGIKNVQYFCSTFNPSQWGSRSPLLGATSQAIQQACQCVLTAATAPAPPKPTSTPPPPPSPVAPVPFKFCPSNTMQLGPFKVFCNTPLWKSWACSCSSVAQACFPNQPMTWCPRPSTSAPASSSTSTIPAPSTTPAASSTTPSTSDAPPATTPVSSSTSAPDVPSSTTDAPVVTPSTTDAPAATPSTTDAPVVSSSSSSSTDDSAATTTSSDNSVPT